MEKLQTLTVLKKNQLKVKNKLTLQMHLPIILRCIKDGYTQEKIGKQVGVSKQAISKLFKQLIKHEYIHLDVRSSANIYEILPRGQLILSGGRKLFEVGIGRLHNLRFKYAIVSGKIPPDKWERIKMVNWTKQVGDVYGVKVEVSEKSLIISPGIFFGYNLVELLPRAKEVSDSIAMWLKSWFKIELGPPKSVSKPEWAVVTPLPTLSLSNMSLRNLDSWLDASRGITEIEFTDMQRAQEFIDIPQKLKEIETHLVEHREKTEANPQSTECPPNDNQKSSTLPSDTGSDSRDVTFCHKL